MSTSYGAKVIDGVIQYHSSSDLNKGDPNAYGGCPRAWHFKYVAGHKEPETKSQATGKVVHKQIETTLKTGVDHLGPIARAMNPWIPEGGPDLGIELEVGDGTLALNGIRVVGQIDMLHQRMEYLDLRGIKNFGDPEHTPEVVDWKSTSSLDWAKKPAELATGTQTVNYGQWALLRHPEATHVRLSHVYATTKGRAVGEKRTILATRELISQNFDRLIPVSAMLRDVAKVPADQSNTVDHNLEACPAWRGCAFAGAKCTASSEQTISRLFGTEGANTMGLLDKLGTPDAAPAATGESIDDAMKKLLAAEAPAAVAQPSPVIPAAVAHIVSKDFGQPQLGGAAAVAWAEAQGIALDPGQGLAGHGRLATLNITDPAALIEIALSLGFDKPAAAPAPPPPIVPPETPASDPALASDPVDTAVDLTVEPSAVDALLNFNMKAKKADIVDAYGQLVEAYKARPGGSVLAPEVVQPVSEPVTGITLYINAIPSGPFESLDAFVTDLCTRLAAQYEAPDIRCAPEKGPLGFGKWKGMLAALALETELPPGAYMIDTRGREIAEVVADALASRCATVVRGIG